MTLSLIDEKDSHHIGISLLCVLLAMLIIQINPLKDQETLTVRARESTLIVSITINFLLF